MQLSFCTLIVIICSWFISPSLTKPDKETTHSAFTLPGLKDPLEAGNLFNTVATLVPYSSGADDSFCTERNCKEPKYLVPVTEYAVVLGASPLFGSVLPLNNKTKDIDNVCYTFFQLEKTKLILFISIVYKNNTYETVSYVKDDIPGRLGTLRGGGPTCTFQEFAVSAQCDLTLILQRCFLFGVCNEFDAGFDYKHDVFFGLSVLPNQADSCKGEHIAFIKSQSGYETSDYVKLPQKLPYKCVTCLPNNGNAINEVKLQDEDKICVEFNGTTANNATQLQEMFEVLQANEKAFYDRN